MTQRVESPSPLSRALALLAVLAPALGGSTQPWARGVLVLATALAIFLWPPRRSPGSGWLLLVGALVLWGLTAFLPASWAAPMPWRQTLGETLAVTFPRTVTVQPWLTLEAWGMLFAGGTFALALLAHPWRSHERRQGAQLYALGILAVAVLAMVSLAAKWPVPWWPEVGNAKFGFFPNRNQTANVLALAGIVTAALGWESLNRQRPRGYLWFGGLLILAVALVLAYSRAGIAIFFGGMVVWVLVSLRFSSSKKGGTLAFAAVLVLLAGFLLFGGDTLQRFQQRTAGRPLAEDFRVEVQRDAVQLAAQRPWIGQGLASFEPVFNVSRTPTTRQVRALHPESDWLWAAVEMGWPAVALVLAALGLWAWRTWPFDSGSDRHLRSAAAVCTVLFALHGLVDVAGHRLGSLWPALFLGALAVRPIREKAESRWSATGFRAAAVVMAVFGGWWIVAAVRPGQTVGTPTTSTVQWLEKRLDAQIDAGEFDAARATADAALRIAPLQWRLYFQRATALAAEPGQFRAVLDDFDRARFLEPRWVPMCMAEARLWLALDSPEVALDSWLEALRRAGPDAAERYREMVGEGWARTALRNAFAELALSRPDFLVVFLRNAVGLDFKVTLGRYLESDPSLAQLDAAQRREVLRLWFHRGERDEFLAAVAAQPGWLADGWPWVAEHYAQKQEFERAWTFVQRYAPPPTLPTTASSRSLAEAEREFHFHPDNVQAGLELFFALRKLRQTEEALTTLNSVEGIAGRPNYVPWLQAELWAEKREWAKAWAAFQKYQRTLAP